MIVEMIVDHDKVTIDGVAVPRKPTVSVTEWIEFWERVINREFRRKELLLMPWLAETGER